MRFVCTAERFVYIAERFVYTAERFVYTAEYSGFAQREGTMTQPVYPSDYKILANVTAGWTDIAGYVIQDIDGGWGIMDNGPLDLVAGTGALELVLNNSTGLFLPDGPSGMAGWKKGIGVKLALTFDGEEYVRWKGIIQSIKPPSGRWEDFRMNVSCVDWMEYAAKHPIVNPGILTNQRGNDVINTTLGLMPIQPAAKDLDTGVSVFSTAFDTVTSHTKALSEFSKVAFSEVGRVYLRKDRVNGETLAFENSQARHGWQALDVRPLMSNDSGFLLKEDGGYLLKEDGGKIILNQAENFLLDNAMQKVATEYGEDVLNRFTVYANPRRIDASAQVLFKLDEPILIGAGQTLDIKGSYADPAGGLPINGQNMITPTTPTDYLVNTAQDGSGTNISASLTITPDYGTEGFTHTVKNTSVNSGWITQFNCRGYGIYQYNPIEHAESDSVSRDEQGVQSETMDQKYQKELIDGTLYARKVVELKRTPRTNVKEIECIANRSNAMMMSFLTADCGLLIHATSDKYNVDSYFFIEGVRFKIKPGGYIMFKLIVRQFWALSLGLSMLAVEFAGGTAADAINFGYLPVVSNLTQRTFSFWIYADTAPVGTNDVIEGVFSDEAGTLILLTTDRRIKYYTKQGSGTGDWVTPVNSIPLTAWTHVVVMRDVSTDLTTDPVIYIDGTLQTLTENVAPSGAINNEAGSPFVIGNWKTATNDYDRAMDGKLKDVRVYNRILSAAEVTTLYNSGTPSASAVTDGMVFQAFAVRTKDLALYVNQTLTESMKLLDNVFGVVGTPHGSPVGRTP